MLQRLALHDSVGPLRPQSLPPKTVFGKHTVVYGHNGSGKSTLADLIAAIGSGGHTGTVTWHASDDGAGHRLAPGEHPSDVHVSAFTTTWVEADLASFLSGEGPGAAAIVTLGSEAVDAASEIEQGERRVADLTERQRTSRTTMRTVTDALAAEGERVQHEIFSTLHGIDQHYSKGRFTVPKVGRRLAEHSGTPNEDGHHGRLVEETRRSGMPALTLVPRPSVDWKGFDRRLLAALAATPTSVLLDHLAGDSNAQRWAQDGIALHRSRDRCCFCDGTVSPERRAALDRHFDESRTRVVQEVGELRAELERSRAEQQAWFDDFPASEQLYPEVRSGWNSIAERLAVHHRLVIGRLDEIDEILHRKELTPETPGPDHLPVPPRDTSDTDLVATVGRHNQIADDHATWVRDRCEEAVNSMIGRRSAAYQVLRAQEDVLADGLVEVRGNLKTTNDRLDDLRSRSLTSSAMAEHLTRDLDRVYGKHHLRIVVASDGLSYACTRDGGPAVKLSEGEKRTLALLYFLRSLEDTTSSISTSRRLIIVDDPSSSLDRECVYGTHAWLTETLDRYGQSIILTHDFELLRMLITSKSNKLKDSRKLLANNDEDEARFPRVAFLEIRARATESGLISYLDGLSEVVLKHPSEYHFLFDRLAAGLQSPDNHDVLFLLPNAARRLLETFVSFHVPDGSNHRERLQKLCDENENAVFKDVHDFCNRFSHGEDRQMAEPLEERVVLREIARCLEFIRIVDESHYLRMMRATGHGDDVNRIICLQDDTRAGDRPGAPAAMAHATPSR